VDGDKPKRLRFRHWPISFFHIDIAEVQTNEGKLCLFLAIDRISQSAVTQLMHRADRKTVWGALDHVLATVPYRIRRILTIGPIERHWSERQWRGAFSLPISPAIDPPSPPGGCVSI
jgi:hypothetical protein